MIGLRLCRTGSPITPTTVVVAWGQLGSRGPEGAPGAGAIQPSPRLLARASLACCWAKVSENASVPFFWTTTK